MKKFYFFIIIIINMIFINNNVEANMEKKFYDLNIKSIEGNIIKFSEFKNKAVMLVNVASNCGFTKQYADLQKLWEKYQSHGLIVIGIPSNQFGQQEPGSNEEIKNFCEVNFNINFPMTEKVEVKGNDANEVYIWAKKNYGKSTIPKWNFHKILINKNGNVVETYSSFTKPNSKKITSKIEEILDIK